MAVNWPTDLTNLLKRISTPAEEVFKGLKVLGDYLKEAMVGTGGDALKVVIGTEFAVYIPFPTGTSDLRIVSLTPGIAITGEASGDLILKSASLMTADGSWDAGTNAGVCLTSDDALYPLDVALIKEYTTPAALTAATLYHAKIDYEVKSGTVINAVAVTGTITLGAGVFVLIFVRATDGATIAAV